MRRTIALLVLVLVVSGCGQTSFVGSRFDNFTAYYNKFFNARKAFDQGLKSLERRDTRIDRSLYLPLFVNPDAAASSSHFQNTIKKSADVLREHPNSKWVDDALLLIGKSYFYQRNYVGAEQKFQEVIALGSALEDEARFWLARTLITGGNYEAATTHLAESMNREEVSRRWKPMLQLALGELYVQSGQWQAAAEALEEGLKSVRDNDLGARAQFLLGQVYETLADYPAAVRAYQAVERFRPLYELSYAAQLSAVRVEGSYVDEESALRQLRRMERDDKHYQYRNELAYVRGRIYQMQGHADDAFLVYDDILYDADGDISRVRGPIHYALGELYHDAYRDYLTAAAHFDTAASVLGSATTPGRAAGPAAVAEVHYAPEAIRDANEQKEMFAAFSDVMYRIQEMDSLLYLGSLDDDTFESTILDIRRKLAEEIAAQQRELERRQASQAFRDAGAAGSARVGGGTSAVAAASGEAGFLYFRDPMLVEEARLNFQTVWGDRPLVPNWRRRTAVNDYLATMSDDPDAAESIIADITSTEEQLPVVDISRIPREHESRVLMRTQRAAASYELANVLFLSMNEPDSAAVWYRMVIDDASDSTLTQRAYYALAEVQQVLGDQEAARALYEDVVRISNQTELGRMISQRLGLSAPVQAEGDTLAVATAAYDRAYIRWQRGNYRSALAEMIEIACRYPNTETAPKALMAAGAIYADWARRDSLDLLGTIPVSVPDSMLQAIGLSARRTRVVPDTTSMAPALPADSAAMALARSPLESLEPSTSAERARSDDEALAAQREEMVDSVEVEVALPPEIAEMIAGSDDPPVPNDEIPDSSAVAARPADELDPETIDPPSDGFPEESELVEEALIADSTEAEARGLQMAAAVDSIIVEEFEPLNLDRLYASIEARYAESPFARRAGRIRDALQERRRELAAADSLARVRADSARAAMMDSLSIPLANDDSTGLMLDSLQGPAAPTDSLAAADSSAEWSVPADSAESLMTPDSTLAPAEAADVNGDVDLDSAAVDSVLAIPADGASEARDGPPPQVDGERSRPLEDAQPPREDERRRRLQREEQMQQEAAPRETVQPIE